MFKFLPAILACCLLTSCATMINSSYKNIAILAEEPVTVTYKNSVFHTNDSNLVTIPVDRSKKPLKLFVQTDSLERDVEIKSKVDGAFYLNFVSPLSLYGGFIDVLGNKMYTYPNVILNKDLTVNQNATFDLKKKINKQVEIKKRRVATKRYNGQLPQKGDLFFDLSFPFIYITHSTTAPETMPRLFSMSVFGFSAGLDYYYKNNRFINLSGNYFVGGDIAIGCGGDDYSDFQRINSYSIMFSHNHKYRKFSFGYGLAYTYNDRWDRKYFFPENVDPNDYSHSVSGAYQKQEWRYSTLGLVFNGYMYFSPNFCGGLIYKPNFVRLKTNSGNTFNYEHQITLDFLFRIKLFGAKKKNK